ncbi:hypothetical protein [Streptomyces sp. NPDC057794]|uniref:hypothetical protein n=1 Tax=Streptomyces sp. NPDC057794 TaxID=3346251 RepID=UPI0036B45095
MALLVVVVGIAVAAGGGGDDEVDTNPPATSDTKTEERTPDEPGTVEPESPSGVGPGTHEVGKDMPAGTYRTAGPSDSDLPNCYWARMEDASGELDAIIANGNPEGPTTVTVNAGEYFQTSGCSNWIKAK